MAGTIMVKMEIDGMKELQSKLSAPFAAQPARNFLNRGGFLIQGKAREYAPIDRGRLRQSITVRLDNGTPIPLFAEIGTNLKYAAAMEFGRKPGDPQPPPGALLGWMSRKGIPASAQFAVSKSIAVSGTTPHLYLTNAIKDSQPKIAGELITIFAREIEAAAIAGGS